jgi:hypothetical protein
VQILGLGHDQARRIHGEDSLQVLVLALNFAKGLIEAEVEEADIPLAWADDSLHVEAPERDDE